MVLDRQGPEHAVGIGNVQNGHNVRKEKGAQQNIVAMNHQRALQGYKSPWFYTLLRVLRAGKTD
jgi:hypothetical protein